MRAFFLSPRSLTWVAALVLLVSACGDDDTSTDDLPAPTTTAPTADNDDEEGPTSTVAAAAEDPDTNGESTPLATTAPDTTSPDRGGSSTGAVTSADGTTATWSLTSSANELCFDAELSNPDAAVAEALGAGVSDCLTPDGGLDAMDGEGLSVSVGALDGERTFGYLWGRVAREVISLTIEHTDGSQTSVELIDGPTDVQLFAVVLDTTTMPPVETLDAVSGTQIEGSVPIRDFLHAGPSYPTVPPVTVPDAELYPTN